MSHTGNFNPASNFARHVFTASRVYTEREKARNDVYSQLHNMRRSIIKMTLTFSAVDTLRHKIDRLIEWEWKYAKFFRPKDSESAELKERIAMLENELSSEREEKLMLMSERDEKIAELTESIRNIKNSVKYLMLEKAKKQHRMKILEKKVDEKADRNGYYSS